MPKASDDDFQAHIVVTDEVSESDDAAVGAGLNAFNDAIVGYADRRPLAVFARDPRTGELLGGMIGRTSLGLLFIDTVHLSPALRGRGLGSQMLRAVEAEARDRGCINGVLYTISFQAPGFYEKHGWHRFGEVPCLPPGTSRVFMTKRL